MAVNIVNPEVIQQYLAKLAGGDAQVAAWLEAALLKILKKRRESAIELTELPADAPEWLQNKWDVCGGPFHKFEPDVGLIEPVRHITDWLVSAKQNGEEIVVHDLQNLATLENLKAAADRYFTRLNKKLANTAENDGDIRTVMKFDDGSRIVQLLTPNALKVEGPVMGHCIGGGNYDKSLLDGSCVFYSLRDADNNPHATFHVEAEGNILRQCKGKGNKPPVQRYMPDVQAFVIQQKFELIEDAAHTGLVHGDNESYYSIYSLPENYSAKGMLILMDCADLKFLPEGMDVSAGLHLQNCTSLQSLPNKLSVGGALHLQGCTGLTSIPRSITCLGGVETDFGFFGTVAKAADAFEAKFGKPQVSDLKKQPSYRQQS